MSTQLLSVSGKVHELCDDLESLWFVLLFEGLHFVKHNKPSGVSMATIFDHMDVCVKIGTHVGGLGKRDMYHSGALMARVLKFDSKPFTTLVRQIYRLFKSLRAYYVMQVEEETPSDSVKENVRKLESCAEIERLLREALDSEGWPVSCDKVEDQYPPIKRLTSKQRDSFALSYASCSLVPRDEPFRGKRKREEEDEPQASEAKRPKINPPLWKRIWSKCTFLVKG